jgi:hypothetical protein
MTIEAERVLRASWTGADAVSFVGGMAANARIADPFGRQLGDVSSRRILRCSPLTPVAPSC